MKPVWKLLFVTVPLTLIGVGGLAYVMMHRAQPERNPLAERATPVRVIVARQQPFMPRITGYGVVAPEHSYQAIARVGATAKYVNPRLEKGAILPAGAVLLRLDQADVSLSIAQAKANIRAAKAKLAELVLSEKNQRAAIDLENEALAVKARDHARLKKLAATGVASKSSLDAARAAWLAQRQKVLTLTNALSLLPSQEEVQTQQIAVYEANLKTAALNLARTTLTLPFAGRVVKTAVEQGQFVHVGQVVANLDGIDAAEIEAQVPISAMMALVRASQPMTASAHINPTAMITHMQDLGLGAVVHLRVGENFASWPAKVVRVSDTIDQKSGMLGVIVQVKNAYSGAEPGKQPPLTKGMFVKVDLSVPPIDAIVIPRNALHQGYVLTVDDKSRLNRVQLTPHLIVGQVALITDGLKPGVRIVVSAPVPALKGMLLKVTRDTALETRISQMGEKE